MKHDSATQQSDPADSRGRSVARVSYKYQDLRNRWIDDIKCRRGKNIANVAVANKNARIAWALLTHKENYRAAAA